MPFVEIAGERFHVALDGPESAPVLMLSNSLGTDLHMWDPQVPEWSRTFRVLRYDARGHGRSAAPDRPYSMAELGGDAIAIMDALKVHKVHWCGLSLGGMVGQWLLANAPERVNRVVLANTSASMSPPDLWNTRIRAVREGGMAGVVDGVIERWFTPAFRAGKPNEAVEKVRAMVLTTPPHGYVGVCAAIRDMDQRESIRKARSPVLVVIGSEDPATNPEMGRLLVRNIPGAREVVLDAAHLSNVEQPQAFTRAVLDFLRQ